MLAPASISVLEFRWAFPALDYKLVEAVSLDCTPADTSPLWQSALTSAESQCARLEPGSSVEIILSNHFVRYLVIPAMPAFTPADQRVAIAAECFRQAYGDNADDWDIRVDPLAHADSMIACAIDSALIAGLGALGKQYRLKIKSLQPYLMSGFNEARQRIRRTRIKASPVCYVQIEPERATIALLRNGAWHAIASGRVPQEWAQEVAAMVNREILLADWHAHPDAKPAIYLADAHSSSGDSGRSLSSATDYEVIPVQPAYTHKAAGFSRQHDAIAMGKV